MPEAGSDRAIMQKGSKSFSFAALLFADETRRAAESLYRWCRYCDDQIDLAPDPQSAAHAAELLQWRLYSTAPDDIEFTGLKSVCARYGIPRVYAEDLINGVESDSRFAPFEDMGALELYCYRVAGTVGLMMAHIMGVSDERALQNAVDLGIAMQLTNIARDVREDFERGRVYLPLAWLREEGCDPALLLNDDSQRERTYRVVRRLLAEADRRYASGYQGLAHLPLRCALTISVAGSVYSAIGHAIVKKGPSALNGRMVIPKWKKILKLAEGLWRVLPLLPRWTGWRKTSIQSVWRPSP